MKIEKLFLNKEVIFCSVKKIEILNTKIDFINNRIILKRFKKNLNLMKKKISKYLKNEKFDIYGAGGSMVLAIASLDKKNIGQIFDNDPQKWGKIFPGTKKKIQKNNKIFLSKSICSLSTYNIKKKNNLNIHKI